MSGRRNSARLRAQKKETIDAEIIDAKKAVKPIEQQEEEEEQEQVEDVVEITPSASEDSDDDDDAPEEETFGSAKQQAAAKEKEITKLVETKKSQERAERRKRDQVLKDQKQEKKKLDQEKQATATAEDEEVQPVVDISDNDEDELLPAELLEQYEDDVQTKRKTRAGSAEETTEPKKRKIAEVIKTVKNKRTVFDKGVVQVKVLEPEASRKKPTRSTRSSRSKLLLPPAAASGKDGVNKSSLTAEWLNRKTLDRRGRVTQKFDKRK